MRELFPLTLTLSLREREGRSTHVGSSKVRRAIAVSLALVRGAVRA